MLVATWQILLIPIILLIYLFTALFNKYQPMNKLLASICLFLIYIVSSEILFNIKAGYIMPLNERIIGTILMLVVALVYRAIVKTELNIYDLVFIAITGFLFGIKWSLIICIFLLVSSFISITKKIRYEWILLIGITSVYVLYLMIALSYRI